MTASVLPAITTTRTFCRFCHAACPMEVDVDTVENLVIGVRGDSADPIFGGYTCTKGRHLPEQHNNPERLRSSLKRQPDGSFAEMPTGQALDEIAAQLQDIVARYGPRAVASYCGTATFQNAAAHPVIRAFHAAIGSPSFYTSITIDQPAKMVTPLRLGSWGAGAQPWSTADVSLVVGINVVVSMFSQPGGPTFVNPLASLRAARQRGLKLIVIDPRRTETASMADIHLQPIPGEDPTLLAGMIRVILDEGLEDREFCEQWVDGLPELGRAVRSFDLAHVAARTGVPEADIVAAARMWAAGPRGTATCGTGPNMAPHGTLTEHLVACLNVLGGRYPRAGERVQNVTGVLGLSGPVTQPRAQVVAPNPAMLSNGAEARMRGLHTIRGQAPTAALADEILEPGEGQVRALLTVGGNPVLAWPDQIKTVRALEQLDLHIAHDIRVSASARVADYVIPSQLSFERPDVPTNVDRWFEQPYVMYTPAVVTPDPEMVDEAGLYIELAKRMGLTLQLPGGDLPPDHSATPDDLLELSYPASRVPWDELRRGSGGSIHDHLRAEVAPADPTCTARFQIAPEGVTGELDAIRAEADSYGSITGYDPQVHTHRMASRRLKGVFNSSGRELESLRAKEGTSFAHAHPDDLAEWGVTDGQLVDISSPRATIRTVVKSAPDVRKGTVSMAHAWGDLPGEAGPMADPYRMGDTTGRLADNASGYDAITGLPVMSAIPIAVRAVR
jgi:anaerobic selenocysteine-containing dehydrogenase